MYSIIKADQPMGYGMITSDNILYAAFKAKNARFDGRFFVGISSTGIFCRAICRARQPKPENCTFYHMAAKTEQAGYRPIFFVGRSGAGFRQFNYRCYRLLCVNRLTTKKKNGDNITIALGYRPAGGKNKKVDGHSRHWKLDGQIYFHAGHGMAGLFYESGRRNLKGSFGLYGEGTARYGGGMAAVAQLRNRQYFNKL